MINVAIAENFINGEETEYVRFTEHLGSSVRFWEDKWVCDKLRRAPAESPCDFTIGFSKINEQYRDMVKYFSSICFIHGKSFMSVRAYVSNLVKFFDFWAVKCKTAGLSVCNEHTSTTFYQYLEELDYTESTKCRIWKTVSAFFTTMNGWNGTELKNPFSISPFHTQKNFDRKYIPENIALQLDIIFKKEDVALHLRCAYWILRLIPSRIGEIAGMRIECLKRYNGNYSSLIKDSHPHYTVSGEKQ